MYIVTKLHPDKYLSIIIIDLSIDQIANMENIKGI